MNSSQQPLREEDPDALRGQELPFGDLSDEPDLRADLEDVQANGQPLKNDQGFSDGKVLTGADVDPPEADPYNLDSLRLSQDFAADAGVKKLVTTIPVRKPSKEWFIRTHPDPSYRLQTAVIELREDREIYLVAPALRSALASEPTFSSRLLVTTINRQGVLFLWSIRLPGADGRIDEWSRSAWEAADRGKTGWVRVTANMTLGAYEIAVATGLIPEPVWPDLSFQEIIRIAFRDTMISRWDHPVLRRLRGEA